jgi:predicted Ser/Thr protein kinase
MLNFAQWFTTEIKIEGVEHISWSEIEFSDQKIAEGGQGTIYSATYKNSNVVLKKFEFNKLQTEAKTLCKEEYDFLMF